MAIGIPEELIASRRKLRQDQQEGNISTPSRAPASSVENTARSMQKKRKAKGNTEVKQSSESSDQSGDFKSSIRKGAMNRLASGGGAGGAGSGANMAGDALMMSGNPYAMAGGAALKVIGSVQAKKQAAAQKKADEENARRARLQDALANLGSGVGTLGMA